MIWLRRILAIPLMFLFVLTFVLGLVLCHVSGTVGSASFYNGQMRKAHVYTWIYDELLPAALDEAAEESDTDFPFDTAELREEVVGVARTAFPPEWLEGTFKGATKKVVPYVVGDKNSFVITMDVRSRIDPMAAGVKNVVDNHKQEITDYVTDDLIIPEVTESLGDSTTLSYGVILTDDEIGAVIKTAMSTDDWAITQFKSMVDVLADYLKGDTASLDLTVNLSSIKATVANSLSTLADDKLRQYFNGLPTCTLAEFTAELATLEPNTLPRYRPEGYSYEQFRSALETKVGMTIPLAVNQAVMTSIGDTWVFNDAQLREVMGEDTADSLDKAREFIVDDQGRITDQDLRDSDDGSNGDEEEGFDQARHAIHAVKIWIWAFWVVAILLLVAIGFLCGRNWKSRLLWPLCVLFVTCLIFVIVVAVASAFVPKEIVPAPDDADATQVSILASEKGDEMAHNAINTFVGGLELKLVLFIVFSGLAIAGVIAWMIIDRRRGQKPLQDDPRVPLHRT